jgi:glyoxylase-like metal-dependent hydrolase (beta-lactamase superfamily II)
MVKNQGPILSQFGRILNSNVYLIRPQNQQYFNANSLLFVDKTKMLIDTGFQLGNGSLTKIKQFLNSSDFILYSHYHIDHTFGSHLFPKHQKFIHETEKEIFTSFDTFLQFSYNHPGRSSIDISEKNLWTQRFKEILDFERLSSWEELSLNNLNAITSDSIIDLGESEVDIIHLPGHSPGHVGVYEPYNSKILFIGDIDIGTKFGPWYGWRNSDLQSFRGSVKKLRDFIKNNEISLVVSSHSEPVSKLASLERLNNFESIFDTRKRKILDFIKKKPDGATISDIVQQSFIYNRKRIEPEFVWEVFERFHIEHHLNELENESRIKIESDSVFLT